MAATTLFLAKLIGLYALIVCAALAVNGRTAREAWQKMVERFEVIYLVSFIELVLGLLVVLSHNFWYSFPAVIVTIFGWLMVIEAIFYLALPKRITQKAVGWFLRPRCYYPVFLICFIVGLYLTAIGFQLF